MSTLLSVLIGFACIYEVGLVLALGCELLDEKKDFWLGLIPFFLPLRHLYRQYKRLT